MSELGGRPQIHPQPDVICPECHVAPGSLCLTVSGNTRSRPHPQRVLAASGGETTIERRAQITESVARHRGNKRLVTTVMAETGASYDEVARVLGIAS